MFRLDRENLGNPCALCKHNRNFTCTPMFGTHVKCNNTLIPTWRKVGDHDVRTSCEAFELDIAKLEVSVYEKYAVALSRTTCGTFNDDGTIKTSISPAWIMHYMLWQAKRDDQFCAAMELKFNRRILREILNDGNERINGIIHTSSKTSIREEIAACFLIFIKMSYGTDYARALISENVTEKDIEKFGDIYDSLGMDDEDLKY